MARVKRSVHGRKHHRAVLEQAKGYYGNKSRTYRSANEQLMHSMQYAFRDRRARKGDFRKLWIQRINAGARLHGLSYSRLINGLHLAGIEVDRKVLADLAVTDPEAFGALVRAAQDALPAERARGRGRFLLSQRLAFTHRRVRRLRGLLQKRSARWTERAFVAEGAELLRRALGREWRSSRCMSRPRATHDPATQEDVPAGARGRGRVFLLAAGRARAGGRHGDAAARARRPAHAGRATCRSRGLVGPRRARWSSCWSTCAIPATPGRCCGPPTPPGSTRCIFSGESVDPVQPQDGAGFGRIALPRPLRRAGRSRRAGRRARGRRLPHPGHRGARRRGLCRRSTGPCPRRCSWATSPPGSIPSLCGPSAAPGHPHGGPGRVAQRRRGLRRALLRGASASAGAARRGT